MAEHGLFPAKGFVEHHVFWCRSNPFLATNDVADFHEVVVDHVGEVVGGKAIGFDQDLVVDLLVCEFDGVPEQIVNDCGFFPFDSESYDVRLAGVYPCLSFRWI